MNRRLSVSALLALACLASVSASHKIVDSCRSRGLNILAEVLVASQVPESVFDTCTLNAWEDAALISLRVNLLSNRDAARNFVLSNCFSDSDVQFIQTKPQVKCGNGQTVNIKKYQVCDRALLNLNIDALVNNLGLGGLLGSLLGKVCLLGTLKTVYVVEHQSSNTKYAVWGWDTTNSDLLKLKLVVDLADNRLLGNLLNLKVKAKVSVGSAQKALESLGLSSIDNGAGALSLDAILGDLFGSNTPCTCYLPSNSALLKAKINVLNLVTVKAVLKSSCIPGVRITDLKETWHGATGALVSVSVWPAIDGWSTVSSGSWSATPTGCYVTPKCAIYKVESCMYTPPPPPPCKTCNSFPTVWDGIKAQVDLSITANLIETYHPTLLAKLRVATGNSRILAVTDEAWWKLCRSVKCSSIDQLVTLVDIRALLDGLLLDVKVDLSTVKTCKTQTGLNLNVQVSLGGNIWLTSPNGWKCGVVRKYDRCGAGTLYVVDDFVYDQTLINLTLKLKLKGLLGILNLDTLVKLRI